MDTDYAVPGEVDRIRARVAKVMEAGATEGEVQTWLRVFSVSNGAAPATEAVELPATFGIIPAGEDLDREIVVELEALASNSDEVLVSRRIKTRFIPGEARLVRALLYRACAGVSCPDGETCGCSGGAACATPACVDESLSLEDLEPIANPGALPPNVDFPDTSGNGGGIRCEMPLMICGSDCVDPRIDPRYCGNCDTSCPSGHVCSGGECEDPGDCRADGVTCSGLTYCDDSTGECLRGCTDGAQCTGNHQICDTELHDCVCETGFDLCSSGCVDMEIDPRFCGNCDTSCPIGEVCENGSCLDLGDCRTNGVPCTGFTYCDAVTGSCLRGCAADAQCVEDNEVCDEASHRCSCAPGFHQCGVACVSDASVDTCGASCTPCPTPPNGSATCDLGACGFVCDPDYEPCGDACCPTVDPCSCEAHGLVCDLHVLCDTAVLCGICDDPAAPTCTGGQCVCVDEHEPNDEPSVAVEADCSGPCRLEDLDIAIQGTLDREDDFDFYSLNVHHDRDYAVRVDISGLASTRQLLLTYVCPNGSQRIADCSGSSGSFDGSVYCQEDGADTLRLIQECGDEGPARATVIVGVSAKAGEFAGVCDTYSLSVTSYFYEYDD